MSGKLRRALRRLAVVLAIFGVAGPGTVCGADFTQAFFSVYEGTCAFGPAHAQALRQYRVLLVPGYFSHLDPSYFGDQMRWLAGLRVDHDKVAMKTGDTVAVNAAIIAAAIRGSAKPVILITHSKGSVDALEALATDRALRGKVKGWISLQGAFFGSPIADMLLDPALLHPAVGAGILAFFGGTEEAAKGLTTQSSLAYYRAHSAAIDGVLREVPAIAFASVIEGTAEAPAQTSLEIPLQLLSRSGVRSDGLLPVDAQVLPGMDFVKVWGVDHIAPVMRASRRFDRVRMTQALLLALPPLRSISQGAGCAPPGAS
jgi:hypothetical protein